VYNTCIASFTVANDVLTYATKTLSRNDQSMFT
jgi:hypothetical protein